MEPNLTLVVVSFGDLLAELNLLLCEHFTLLLDVQHMRLLRGRLFLPVSLLVPLLVFELLLDLNGVIEVVLHAGKRLSFVRFVFIAEDAFKLA